MKVTRGTRQQADAAPVYSITATRGSGVVDLATRKRRYLISMAIRTICFVLAVVVTGPLRWVLIAAAVLLPYVAVVLANAGRQPRTDGIETPGVVVGPALEDRSSAVRGVGPGTG